MSRAGRVLRGTDDVEVADERHCFSGDSFYWSRTTGDIEVAERVTRYSIEELAASLARTARWPARPNACASSGCCPATVTAGTCPPPKWAGACGR